MNSTFGKPWHRWENNVKTDRNETGWKGVVWIHLAQHMEKRGPEDLLAPEERLLYMTQCTTKFLNKYTQLKR
jgi:hypothetical protein